MSNATQNELTTRTATSEETQAAQRNTRYTNGYAAGSKAPVGHSSNYGMFDPTWGEGFKAAQRAKAAFLA